MSEGSWARRRSIRQPRRHRPEGKTHMTQISTPPGDTGAQTERVWQAAAEAGAAEAGNLERRRSRFLRLIREALGPAQFQHTTGHCEEVSRIAGRLATLMGLDSAQVALVRLAGLLHDIGKALVPDRLLAKPGPLSRPEREWMNRHA